MDLAWLGARTVILAGKPRTSRCGFRKPVSISDIGIGGLGILLPVYLQPMYLHTRVPAHLCICTCVCLHTCIKDRCLYESIPCGGYVPVYLHTSVPAHLCICTPVYLHTCVPAHFHKGWVPVCLHTCITIDVYVPAHPCARTPNTFGPFLWPLTSKSRVICKPYCGRVTVR